MKLDTTNINATVPTELCRIMTKCGSDKGNGHNYTVFYYELFKNLRYSNLNIFEVGLGTNNINIPSNMGKGGTPGASLRGWKEFFPNANIVGADIDRDILFVEDRITTYYCNQLDADTITNMWKSIPEHFDIIVDDGLHTPEANITFFQNSYHKLNTGGTYIIEDIFVPNMIKYDEYFSTGEYSYQKIILDNHTDNNFILVWR